ncbi:MAG TPA: HAD family hydrolase [Acetobacteraceae bacterium]|nr:HAD family hydrolase [Acetobacteraceae bacterium]
MQTYPLSALIFDVDGTLAETEELHREAFNEAFGAAGLDWHWDQALYGELLSVTGGKERIAHFQQRAGLSAPLGVADIAALHADKTVRYARRVAAGGISLRPGIRRLILEAKQAGLRTAIATTTSRPNVEALLQAVPPLPAFDVIAAGDEVAAKKPAPDIYLLALRQLGLPAESCIALEDTVNGVRSAAGAGLACLVTTSIYGGAGPFSAARSVVTDLGEPTAPARALAGPPLSNGMVDVAWLAASVIAAPRGG